MSIHPDEVGSFTLRQWTEFRNVSRSRFYKLKQEGKAPRFYRNGTEIRISREADSEWLSAREAEAAGA
jgi:hypothetical protein